MPGKSTVRKIHLSFLENVFELNCKKCTGICCRGFDYMVTTKDEYRAMSRRYPFLRRFSARIRGSAPGRGYDICRFSDCWFLGRKYCTIHEDGRRDVRTVACRLYPFMNFSKCHGTLVVSVRHLRDCLYVVKRGAKPNDTGMHAGDILRDVKKIMRAGFRCKTAGWNVQRLNLEKRILALSRSYLDRPNYLDFVVAQFVAAQRYLDAADVREQIEDRVRLWKEFLEVEDLRLNNKRIAYEMTVLTPILRLERWMIGENVVPILLAALYVSMLMHASEKSGRFAVKSYVTTLEFHAPKFLHLNEDLETKRALVRYAGASEAGLGARLEDLSICALATRLKLGPEDRTGFLSSLGR